MSKNKKTIAQKTGTFFAHFQVMVDDITEWGFSHLKRAGKIKEEEIDESDDSMQTKVKIGAKKTAQFFGEMGETFYKEYKKLKAEKKKK